MNARSELDLLKDDYSCEFKTVSQPHSPFAEGDSVEPRVIAASKPFHNHDGYEIFLLQRGKVNFYTEGGGCQVHPGELVLLGPYRFHRGEPITRDVYDRVVINIRQSALKALCTKNTDLGACFESEKNALTVKPLNSEEFDDFIQTAEKLRAALNENSGEFGSDALAAAYTTELLVLINRITLAPRPKQSAGEGIMPPLVAETFEYIEAHLSEELSLDALSKHMHLSGAYISRAFRHITGIPLQQYILRKRVALAQTYLRQGIAPGEVCYMAGFNNYSNFSRTFSQICGRSPKKYQIARYAKTTED